ncbi:mitochondrial distribution and morphology protein 34 [Kwoniella dendrophila CBS 6074]|uniref:Mitochondrial distribution and morphology protein 34 n=1 Tax=Kwoniella dendrophila CBS 6074 TaxID=1295534 RepID=A0AAX4K4S9_9TREE
MSFVFPSWSTAFSPAFHEDAKAMLEAALNKGNKPPVIQGRIEVVELSMGKEPPTLTLLEIGDLSLDRFRGILRLGYSGDAWLEVRCRVQANPLSHNPNLNSSLTTLPLSTPLLASQPLLVPMTLRLSKLHLRAILILVVSQSKGITLVFKNDPLQNVDVSSTFDSVEVIRGYLQQEIEGQLREMFREDLPGIIHRLSQRWFHNSSTNGKVETPYKDINVNETIQEDAEREDQENDDMDDSNPFAEPQIFPPHNIPNNTQDKFTTPRKSQSLKQIRNRRPSNSNSISESPTSYTIFPDIEDYDPTYGLRPEGVPTHSGYEAFGRLWEKSREGGNRGLGSLMSMPIQHQDGLETNEDYLSDEFDDDEDDEVRSFDMVEMNDVLRSIPTPARKARRQSLVSTVGSRSRYDEEDREQVEWETFPAVGGGLITRPRVYHSQSLIRAPSEAGGAMPSPSGTATGGSVTARASSVGGASSTVGSLRMMRPFTPSTTPGLGIGMFSPTMSQAGPSSLRRMVTSRSDVFLSSNANSIQSPIPRSESYTAIPGQISYNRPTHRSSLSLSRRQSNNGGSSSIARTSGSSYDTNGGGGQSSRSTNPTSMSTIPPSKSSSKSFPINQSSSSKALLQKPRNPSISGTSPGTSYPPTRNIGPNGNITLPLNNSVSQLASLSHSAHTLSPYARGHEHIAVRSFPYLGRSSNNLSTTTSLSGISALLHSNTSINSNMISNVRGGGAMTGDFMNDGMIKARRKRIHRLNTTKKPTQPNKEEEESRQRGTRENSFESGIQSSSRSGSNDLNEVDYFVNSQYSQSQSKRNNANRPNMSINYQDRKVGLANFNSLNTPNNIVKRPNMSRSPYSRTSYGFPQS